jgi:ferredoxin-type protein NapH
MTRNDEDNATLKKLRKKRIKKAKKSRKLKQYILGTIFLILLILGWFYTLIGYFIPLCMIAGIGIASRKGRKWCNWMCPRGSFSDSYMKLISAERKIPAFLRRAPLRIGVILFLMSMLLYQITRLWPDPYAIGKLFMTLLTITTAVSIVLALIIHQRSWCYICPIGTISNWVGKNRGPLCTKNDLCNSCKLCSRTCPMILEPCELKEKGNMSFKGDCLKCGLCVETCPVDALTFKK